MRSRCILICSKLDYFPCFVLVASHKLNCTILTPRSETARVLCNILKRFQQQQILTQMHCVLLMAQILSCPDHLGRRCKRESNEDEIKYNQKEFHN